MSFDVFKYVLKIMRKNKIINVTLVSTYILAIMVTIFMGSYVNYYLKVDLYNIPDEFNQIIYLKYLPNDYNTNVTITMGEKDLEQCRLEFQSESTMAPLIDTYVSTSNEQLEKIGFYLFATDSELNQVFPELPIMSGEFFLDDELDMRTNKIVVSQSLCEKIFKTTNVVGNIITINGNVLTVSGVIPSGAYNYLSGELTEDFAIVSMMDYSNICNEDFKDVGIELVLAKVSENQLSDFAERYFIYFEEVAAEGTIKVAHYYRTLAQTVKENTKFYELGNHIIQLISYFGIFIAIVNLLLISSSNRNLQDKNHAIKKALGISKDQLRMEIIMEYGVISIIGAILGWVTTRCCKQLLLKGLNVTDEFIQIPSLIIIVIVSFIVGVIIALYNTEKVMKENIDAIRSKD